VAEAAGERHQSARKSQGQPAAAGTGRRRRPGGASGAGAPQHLPPMASPASCGPPGLFAFRADTATLASWPLCEAPTRAACCGSGPAHSGVRALISPASTVSTGRLTQYKPGPYCTTNTGTLPSARTSDV
jgi:hypothetical protein